ncbi:MAG: DEAD/DEAH box helicase, partial [Spirochaetota bacterium]
MPISLSDDVRFLKGVGPSVAARLENLGIRTVEDLLFHFPRDYEDRRSVTALRNAREGHKATFHVRVVEQGSFTFRGRRHPKITVADATGKANLFCFHRPFMRDALPVGTTLYLTGSPGMKYRVPAFSQFEYEVDRLPGGAGPPGNSAGTGRVAGAGGNQARAGAPGDPDALRIVPIYPLTAGINQKTMRRLVRHALELAAGSVPEVIPGFIIKGYRLKPRGELLGDVHFPPDMHALRSAREALSYQEFFRYQVVVSLARRKTAAVRKQRRETPGELKRGLLGRLPFRLTAAQERVLEEIEADLRAPAPMNRLVQGDVGSGKTMVALLASLGVVEGGGQVAFMAPTEVLARQHYGTIREQLEGTPVEAGFLSGS